MLQWMGGSRRKYATSRKSTYKRQKQYFEQKKRQLQQQTAGLESYSDRNGSCTLQCGNNRSLDILSLENISTLAHNHKGSCSNARDNLENKDFTSNHQDAYHSLVSPTNQGIPVDQSEINEETTTSRYDTKDEHSEKFFVHQPDRTDDIAGSQRKLDSFKLSPTEQISVIDLLGDDGGANNEEEDNSSYTQEAHVSFFVKGLGKVGMETPVHSPKIPGRNFPNCFSPQKKTRRQPITAKHLDYDFYDLGSGVDNDFSQYDRLDTSIDQLFHSEDVLNFVSNPYQKSKSFRSSAYNWNGCDFQGVFRNDELACNIQDSGRNIWNGPSVIDESIDDLGEYDSFSKNWIDQRDIDFDDYFHCKDLRMQDLNFEGWDIQKKRFSAKRTETFNMKESPVQYPKHRTTKDLPDVVFSDKMWPSSIGIDKDAVNHLAREDTTESLSLLSEESCTSTAARGDATMKSGKWEHKKGTPE
ncbi:hypothetical protein ACS0TY_008058 [Phlomoides rotata]